MTKTTKKRFEHSNIKKFEFVSYFACQPSRTMFGSRLDIRYPSLRVFAVMLSIFFAVTMAIVCQPSMSAAEDPSMYPTTIATLQELYLYDYNLYLTFTAYANEASIDGQYTLQALFSALAESKAVHLNAMERILQSLGIGVGQVPRKPVAVGKTRDNVQAAYAIVSQKLPHYYAWTQKQGRGESYRAMSYLFDYLRKTANQYRAFFDRIQALKRSDEREDSNRLDSRYTTYYICQVCGAITHRIPQYVCPVCYQSPSNYQQADSGIPAPVVPEGKGKKTEEEIPSAIIPIQ